MRTPLEFNTPERHSSVLGGRDREGARRAIPSRRRSFVDPVAASVELAPVAVVGTDLIGVERRAVAELDVHVR